MLASWIVSGANLKRHLVVGPKVDCLHVAACAQVPEVNAVAVSAAEQIFGTDQTPVTRELEARLAEGSTEHIAYLGYEGDVVASVARLYTHPSSAFGGLYGGGTLEGHRGRGLYRATVQRRAHDAQRAGARYLRVDALPTSQPILERLGFEVLTYVWPCLLVE